MNRSTTVLPALALALALAGPLGAAERDWPSWNGPHRNLTSLGNDAFPGDAFGLERVWARPLGSGYSGIAIVGGKLVTGFSDGESDYLAALDARTGEERWRYRIADAYAGHDGSDDGPIGTPTIADGTVYGIGPRGQLFALRLEDGEELWAHKLDEEFGARKPEYGFSTTPTVVGGVLVVQTGGPDGRSISGFDRETGELRWSAADDAVGHQSPLALRIDGEEQVFAVTNKHILGLDPENGEVLWRHEHASGEDDGFSQPVPVGEDRVLLTYWPEAALFRIAKSPAGFGVEEVWRSRALKSTYAIPVPYEGHLYGFSGRFLTCVDAATGETVWKSRPPGGGDLVLVDGHLVIQARSGEVVVAEATPAGYREKARVQALERGYLTRPSFAGGRVYVRNLEQIAAVGVTDRAPAASVAAAAPAVELAGAFGDAIRKVQAAESEHKTKLVDELLAAHETFPILEGERVHFVYRGEVDDLALSGNFIQDGPDRPMHRVEGTDLWFRTVELPAKSHFVYRFSVFDEPLADPRNPRKIGPEGSEQSVLTTPGWEEPAYLREPEGARGQIEKLAWKSELLGNEREVQVYLPPGYGEGEDRYPLLVVNHGDQALSQGHMDRALDNLVGNSVAPLIVAFVPRLAWAEYAGSRSAEYSQALAAELVPHLDATFRTVANPDARGVLGVGSAGFISVYAAFKRPGLFGKAAAQSYYHGDSGDELLAMIEEGEKRDLDLFFHTSLYDYKNESSGLDARRAARELAAKLTQKGYEAVVHEVSDGVGWGMWSAGIGRILEALFPLEPSS